MNAEFQRIARRDKKAFLSDQCKEMQWNGKTRDLFKKIRDTKRTFHAKMGAIKDRNSMDLTKVESQETWNNGKFGLGVQDETGRRLIVLPRECAGHRKHSLPTIEGTTLHMEITRWFIPKSD